VKYTLEQVQELVKQLCAISVDGQPMFKVTLVSEIGSPFWKVELLTNAGPAMLEFRKAEMA